TRLEDGLAEAHRHACLLDHREPVRSRELRGKEPDRVRAHVDRADTERARGTGQLSDARVRGSWRPRPRSVNRILVFGAHSLPSLAKAWTQQVQQRRNHPPSERQHVTLSGRSPRPLRLRVKNGTCAVTNASGADQEARSAPSYRRFRTKDASVLRPGRP